MLSRPAHEYRLGDDVVRLQRAEESLRRLRRRIAFQYVAIELIDANREEQRKVPGDVNPGAPPLFRDDDHRLDAIPELAHQSEERFQTIALAQVLGGDHRPSPDTSRHPLPLTRERDLECRLPAC